MGKIFFYCQSCGHETPKWHGKCPSCGEWNTIVEEVKSIKTKNQPIESQVFNTLPTPIFEINNDASVKSSTHDPELDIVLGGGIVSGSVILLAGEPGIGKSTLLLQMALRAEKHILYVSGEEAKTQIKLRADRIGIKNKLCSIYSETSISKIINHCIQSSKTDNSYSLLIIDSIQTLYSDFLLD